MAEQQQQEEEGLLLSSPARVRVWDLRRESGGEGGGREEMGSGRRESGISI